MAETLRGGLSLTLSGFASTLHDIGGFEASIYQTNQEHPLPEIYHRWVAYDLFSPHSRLHSSGSYHVPWQYGEEAAEYMARFLNAKHRLMPYLYRLALDSNAKGHPMQRAMFLEFPEDRTIHWLDRQYMLGPSLLVAPVVMPQNEESEYYIPTGPWTSFFHPDHYIDGPIWVKEKVPLDEIPVWVRPGTILCPGPDGIGRPDYNLAEKVEAYVYELSEGESVRTEVPTGKGIEIIGVVTAECRSEEVLLKATGNVLVLRETGFSRDCR